MSNLREMLQVTQEGPLLNIDARDCIRSGHHPRFEILSIVDEAPKGTICEIHVPHKTGPLIAALEDKGMNVAVAETEPGHWRLRVLKM